MNEPPFIELQAFDVHSHSPAIHANLTGLLRLRRAIDNILFPDSANDAHQGAFVVNAQGVQLFIGVRLVDRPPPPGR